MTDRSQQFAPTAATPTLVKAAANRARVAIAARPEKGFYNPTTGTLVFAKNHRVRVLLDTGQFISTYADKVTVL